MITNETETLAAAATEITSLGAELSALLASWAAAGQPVPRPLGIVLGRSLSTALSELLAASDVIAEAGPVEV